MKHIDRGLTWRPRSASIVINNYNYATFLGRAIDSALGQTHKAQVIVVDDGSSDNSRQIIRSYSDRIETVLKPNGGHASAFNAGYERAKGDIVLFLDSDDEMEPFSVETLLRVWRNDTVVAHFPMTVIDKEDGEMGTVPDPHSKLADGDVLNELLSKGYFASTVTSGMAFARDLLEQIMPVPEGTYFQGADGYLLRAAAFFGPFQYVDKRLARYRVHNRNDSNPWGERRTIVGGFRHRLNLEQNFLETIRDFASRFDTPAPSDLGNGNPTYVSSRLFSLLLDPPGHPINGDRRLSLLRNFIAVYRTMPLPAYRRIAWITVATVSTFAGKSTAATLIKWMGDANSRPAWIKKIGRRLKRQKS